jgi:hypothetical protein
MFHDNTTDESNSFVWIGAYLLRLLSNDPVTQNYTIFWIDKSKNDWEPNKLKSLEELQKDTTEHKTPRTSCIKLKTDKKDIWHEAYCNEQLSYICKKPLSI